MWRAISEELQIWKRSPKRRVLLLRGARQTGKTYSVRELAKEFKTSIEVNFYEQPELKKLFDGSLKAQPIVKQIEGYFGTILIPGESLLFFDEIQACPNALTALRFFHEQLPDLHVIAAGSLLEFALSEIPSFGLGRIESMFMYPLTVDEYIRAIDSSVFADLVAEADCSRAFSEPLHRKAIQLIRSYSLVGGLPAVVKAYQENMDLNVCGALLADHVVGYEDDFAKYKTKIAPEKLSATLRAVALQAGSKFVYSRINPGASVSGYDQALELLCLAGLAHRVYRTAAGGLPLGSQINPKKFKVLPLDTGIYNSLLGLRLSNILLKDETTFVNSGAIAEILCGLELISNSSSSQKGQAFYWDRDEPSGNAEVDYVVQEGQKIVPIEVKAGTRGQMQSLYHFMSTKNLKRGIRCSLEPFSSFTAPVGEGLIEVVPLYAIGQYLKRRMLAQ